MNRAFSFAFRITSAAAALLSAMLYGYLCVRTIMFMFYDIRALVEGGYKLVPKENLDKSALLPDIAPYAATLLLLVLLAVFAVITLIKPRKRWPAVTMRSLLLILVLPMCFHDTTLAEFLTLRYWCPPLFRFLQATYYQSFLYLKFYLPLASVVFLVLSCFREKQKN